MLAKYLINHNMDFNETFPTDELLEPEPADLTNTKMTITLLLLS